MNRAPITSKLLSVLGTQSGRPVGDGDVPAPTTDSPYPSMPYAVLIGLDGGQAEMGPPLADATSAAALPYQVTCVGLTRDQVEQMADLVVSVVFGRTSGHPTNSLDAAAGTPKVIGRELQMRGALTWEGELAQIVVQFTLYAAV